MMNVLERGLLTLVTAVPLLAQQTPARVEYLDNGILRVGVDLRAGAAISYLSLSGVDDNVINIHDLGRYLQQSYYSGPCPFIPDGAKQHPGWSGWCWNPIQAGDVFGNPARTLSVRNTGTRLIARSIPKQWALDNIEGECLFETEITLDQNRVHLRLRLENDRPDENTYPAVHQELPAVYTIGRLHRLFTYTGDTPFSNAPVTQIQNSGPPWTYWNSTECWTALVDESDWGLGVFHPKALLTVGGFSGTPGIGGPTDNPTGYFAPIHTEVLDHNIHYEYEVTMILGDLHADIRAWAYANPPELRPDHDFTLDRDHCFPVNLSDPSPPYSGHWSLILDQPDPQLYLPPGLWKASQVPTLYVTAAFNTHQEEAEVFFAAPGEGFSGDRRISFPITGDGVMRTYPVDLASHPLYSGPMGHLRIDPIVEQTPGDEVQLASIRFYP